MRHEDEPESSTPISPHTEQEHAPWRPRKTAALALLPLGAMLGFGLSRAPLSVGYLTSAAACAIVFTAISLAFCRGFGKDETQSLCITIMLAGNMGQVTRYACQLFFLPWPLLENKAYTLGLSCQYVATFMASAMAMAFAFFSMERGRWARRA